MNVKKLLKQQKSAVMPSDSVKRRVAADCGIEQEVVTNAGGGVAVKTKRNAVVATCVCCCCCAAVATACAISLLNSSTHSITPDVINFGSVSSATEFYAYSAVSVGTMLDGTDLESVASAFALADTYNTSSTISTEITDLQKKILDKYAVFATGMLGEGKITSSLTSADMDGYEFKLNIGYSDGFGSLADTVLYFNKVEGTVKVEGDEEEFDLEGVLVKGDVSYPVEGKYETEADGSETESEIEFKVYTSTDNKSYIQIGYEHSSDTGETESELVVKVYENNDLTEKAKIKGETGEDTSFEVDVEHPDGGDDVKIKFNPFEEDGKKSMQVDAWFGENKHELIMQNRPWEQGGGFDFISRGNGNSNGADKDEKDDNGTPDSEFDEPNRDDIKDKEEDKDNEKDKDKEDKKEPIPYPEIPGKSPGIGW